MSTFSAKGSSWEAEAGCHDDIVMGLVLFGWLTSQKYFKELTDIHTLAQLRDFNDEQVLNNLTPFGIITTGQEEYGIEENIYAVHDDSWIL